MREWERKEGKTTAGSRCPRRAARPAPASSSAPRGGIRAGSPLHKAAARPALPIPSQGAMQAVPRRGGSLEGAPCPREAGEQVSCAGRAGRAALGRGPSGAGGGPCFWRRRGRGRVGVGTGRRYGTWRKKSNGQQKTAGQRLGSLVRTKLRRSSVRLKKRACKVMLSCSHL